MYFYVSLKSDSFNQIEVTFMCIISRWYICCGVYGSRVVQLITLLTSSVSAGSWSVCQNMETFIFLLVLLKSFISKLWFRLGHFSLQNPKNFWMHEPFRFLNGRFFCPYETVNKYSNATLLHQIVFQNLWQKNLEYSETDLDVQIKMQKSILTLSIVMYKICQCVLQEILGVSKKYTKFKWNVAENW